MCKLMGFKFLSYSLDLSLTLLFLVLLPVSFRNRLPVIFKCGCTVAALFRKDIKACHVKLLKDYQHWNTGICTFTELPATTLALL